MTFSYKIHVHKLYFPPFIISFSFVFAFFFLPSVSCLLPLIAPFLSSSVSLVKFENGEWVLDRPQFVLAVFLDVTALECQLPLEDGQVPANLDPGAATNRPLARWQIKVSPVSVFAKHTADKRSFYSTFLCGQREDPFKLILLEA